MARSVLKELIMTRRRESRFFGVISIAMISLLSACGGGGSATGSGENGELVEGDTITVGAEYVSSGQTFTVTSISADRSEIKVSAISSGFVRPASVPLEITLVRGSDGMYRYQSTSLYIEYNPQSGTFSWSIEEGTSEEGLINEVLASTGKSLVNGNSSTANYNLGEPSSTDMDGIQILYSDVQSELQQFAAQNSLSHDIDFSYENINVLGLSAAHADGWTGLGAKVLIIDEFGPSYSGFSNGAFTHGVSTSYTAFAVSPEATITITEEDDFDYNGTGFFANQHVANWSFGMVRFSTFDSYSSARDVANYISDTYYQGIGNQATNAVLVYAAGNAGDINSDSIGAEQDCSVSGARYTLSSCSAALGVFAQESNYDYLDRTIWVGAYDNVTRDLEEYSFSAGKDAMNHFLVADGHSVINASEGTSFAAPRVAGVLALTVQKFPNLTAAERKNLVLHTAHDLGTPGVDPVFGHGLVDAEAALNPIGQLR